MRRGLAAVGGAGDAAGADMIAGTILVFGPCGIRPGVGMRRGTIGLFGPEPPELPLTFRYGCRLCPSFLDLLFGELRRRGYPLSDDRPGPEFDLYHGDLVTVGRGEILIPTRPVRPPSGG
jgi:formylmethanofuran dehydrogenase subunit C